MNKIIKKCLLAISVTLGCLLLCKSNAKAAELKELTVKAAEMINAVYEAQEQQILSLAESYISAEDADYGLSMETYYSIGDICANMDTEGLIAAYAVMIAHDKAEGFAGLSLFNVTYAVKYQEEIIPERIVLYAETEDGTYRFDKVRYVTEDTEYDIYEDIGNERYRKTGEKSMVVPVKRQTKYLEFKIECREPEALLTEAGLESYLDEYASRKYQISMGSTANGLTQLLRLMLPEDSREQISQQIPVEELDERQTKVLSTALSLYHKIPYEWGGKSVKPGYDTSWWTYDEDGTQKGLDCSGYMEWIFRTCGYPEETCSKLHSTASALQNLELIDREELKPGDFGLLNYGESINHIGMYIGNGYWIHCNAGGKTVEIDQFRFQVFARLPEPEFYEELEEPQIDILWQYEQTDENVNALADLIATLAETDGLNAWVAIGETVLNNMTGDSTIEDEARKLCPNIEENSATEDMLTVSRMLLAGQIRILNELGYKKISQEMPEGEYVQYGSWYFIKTDIP